MKEYNVDIQFTGWWSIRVSAENKEDAERYATEMFSNDVFGNGYNMEPENIYVE